MIAPLLGWDDDAARAEKQAYARRVAQIAAAETERTDEEAVAHLTAPVCSDRHG